MAESFCVINLGCKVNRIEADTIRAALLAAGCREAPEAQAGLCLVNTCTVTAEADAKARKLIRRLAGSLAEPMIIVTGCAAALQADALSVLSEKVQVMADRNSALTAALELLKTGNQADAQANTRTNPAPNVSQRVGEGFHTRVGVKIQDGCSNNCSYCIVPRARGAARSRSFEEILAECRAQLLAGARELVISGINVGVYQDRGLTLSELLTRLCALPGDFRLRLSSLEPEDLSEDLLQVFLGNHQRLCWHLHIPLQSGSDRILELMNRRYRSGDFLALVKRARSLLPGLAITTDCIAGFPEETEADFDQTMEVARQAQFSGMHVFRYSQRPETPAAAMTQVDAAIRARRAAELRELATQLSQADRQSRLHSQEWVLMESEQGGRGESYHRVRLVAASTQSSQSSQPKQPVLAGQLGQSGRLAKAEQPNQPGDLLQAGQLRLVRYTGWTDNGLLAELCDPQAE